MDSGSKVQDQNFLFAWRGWYYIYPIHYDMYDAAKGNDWIEQTAGWMVENATPSCMTVDEAEWYLITIIVSLKIKAISYSGLNRIV